MEEKENQDIEKALRESLNDFQSKTERKSSFDSRCEEVDRRQLERTERLLAGMDPDQDEVEKVLRG